MGDDIMGQNAFTKLILSLLVIAAWNVASVAMAENQSAAQNTYPAENGNYNTDMTNNMGVGINVGTMTGPQIKWWLSNSQAFDAGMGFNSSSTAFFADYLFHFNIQNGGGVDIPSTVSPYIGVGVVGGWGGNSIFNHNIQNFGFGFRVPLGVEFLPHGVPMGFFGEVQPGIGVAPDTFGFLQADLGGRYYF